MKEMKNFWKTALAAATGVLLLSIVLSIFSSFVFAGLISGLAAENGPVVVPQDAVLNIDMSQLVIGEQTLEDNPFASISGGNPAQPVQTLGILDATLALEAAATDPRIRFAYIRPDAAADITHLEEFRVALSNFRQSGKAVIAYMEHPTNGGYYLASVADRIYMSEYNGGMNMLIGISGRMLFVKDLLDRLGINMQLIRHGKYKSAGEMYIRNSASPENMEQNSVMIKGIWNEMATAMAAKPEISVEEFNSIIDNLELDSPSAFVEKGFVNELVGMNGMKSKLCELTGKEKYSDIQSISLYDYASVAVKTDYRVKDKLAIIYADGEIVDGNGKDQVAGKNFAEIINQVAADDDVKIVVLRVNSPGGSVVASSQIKEALDALRAKKEVIASYGSYAASGGYWISSCSDYIFSDATTLTGSIGVFGIIPDFGKAVKNIAHVNVTAVPSNKHSDMYSAMRPLSDKEHAFVQKDIEAVYTQFTSLVAGGRNMSVERVDELGQGRVWTGRDALANGLVDRIGTLKDAVDYAAAQAGLSNYRIAAYPTPATFIDQLMESLQPEKEEDLVSLKGIGSEILGTVAEISSLKEPKVYARLPYTISVR